MSVGNLLQLIALETGRDFQLHLASLYGGIARVKGLLWVWLDAAQSLQSTLNHILVQNQDIFEEWSAFTATNSILFGEGLVATIGDKHKRQRKMLNPVFSVKHLRGMTPTFFDIAKKLEHAILNKVDTKAQEIDMTGWLNRTALELVGQSGLGHSFVDFSNEGSNTFADAAKDLAASVSAMVPLAPLTPILVKLGPPGLRRFMIRMTPWPLLQKLRQIVDIMADGVLEIYQTKKRDMDATNKVHEGDKDIIGILMNANSDSLEKDRLSDSELLGQMATLIFTATDTSSGAIARLLHLLAQHPDVQERLRNEVANAFPGRDLDLDYDEVFALPYLDAVIKETLRVTSQDSVVPLLNPIRGVDGKELHEVTITQGTDIFISVLGANHDKLIWGEDASEWKPDRWLKPLPESVTSNSKISGVYSHMMTFLTGGRACM
ncbi:hypothetical protein HWV62_29182 [Athelia sp. TMB]|nr:hypothetical protein HWV62_29182 [Athelia sp. TMB]